MSLNLGSPVLDVAFGLSFVFFLLSVISSAIGEGIAWGMKQRSKTLEKGLKGMFGDPDFGKEIYQHPLVQPDLRPKGAPPERTKILKREKKPQRPSYVSPRNFALALTQRLKEAGGFVGKEMKYGAEAVDQIDAGIKALDPKLREQVEPLWHEAEKDLDKFRRGAEKWFDDAMDRVSGWYKRWSQWVTIGVAIAVAVLLNASALRVADRLYNDEAVRTSLVSGAEGAVQGGSTPKATAKETEKALGELEQTNLPIFWAEDNLPWNSWQDLGESIVGCLVTAVAISLGAPFWFDALGKVSRLRTAGKKPEAATDPEATPPATIKVVSG